MRHPPCIRAIARELGRSANTIPRKIRRNTYPTDWIANELNERPRERHNFRTPNELFHGT